MGTREPRENMSNKEYDIQFLNVDLELESEYDLSRLVKDLGEEIMVMHDGTIRNYHHLACEITSGNMSGADEIINDFCPLIEQFPPDIKSLWEACCTRIFDIGYESGSRPQSFRSELRASTLQRVANIGAGIIITIYPIPEGLE
jgi:hypothetical protein